MVNFARRVVRKVRRTLGVEPRQGVTSSPGSVKAKARILIESGLFDEAYYRAQSLIVPPGITAATEHFVSRGMPAMLSFHPLILPIYLPAEVRRLWQAKNIAAVLEWLSSPEGQFVAWSPHFAPRVLTGVAEPGVPLLEAELEDDEDVEEPDGLDVPSPDRIAEGESVLQWLRDCDDDTILPIDPRLGPREPLRYGQLREHMLREAAYVRHERARKDKRTLKTWDAAREHEWRAKMAKVAIPTKDPPLVSIIMPAWNRDFIVLTAIESVQAQTFGNWELLVVDDGSTDETRDRVREVSARDPRVRLIEQNHGGVSAARNAGIAASSGAYIAFLDSDNTWQHDYLEFALKGLIASNLPVAYAAIELTDPVTGEVFFRAFEGGLEELKTFNFIDLNVLLVDAALAREIGGFDVSLRRWVDHDFALRLAARTPLALLPFIGCLYENGDDFIRITNTESESWQYVVLEKAWVDWEKAEREMSQRVPGRVSVVIPTYRDVRMTIGAVRSLREFSGAADIEIIIVENGSPIPVALTLCSALYGVDNVRVVPLPRNLNFALGSNAGVAASTGEFILFLNNDTRVRSGWLDPLVARLANPRVVGVQPVLLYGDDTIQSAGTIFPVANALPTHFLVGHSRDDAATIGSLEFSAVTAAALLMRATDVIALRGFDTIYVNGSEDVDLCLRAIEGNDRRFAVEPASIITHLESKTPGRGANIPVNRQIFMERWRGRLPAPQDAYAPTSFSVAHIGSDDAIIPAPKLLVTRPSRTMQTNDGRSIAVLRWSIKNPATAGKAGDRWGDTHFIDNLVDGFRAIGQEAVAYRRSAFNVPATMYDDVNLAIRGLIRVRPQPAKINVLWVISHPELVGDDELAEFDLVFAASEKWARETTARTGVTVTPLLQATDPRLFNLTHRRSPRDQGVIFVGQARPEFPRKIVMDAIEAGVTPRVWGPRWDLFIRPEFIAGEYVDNAHLGQLYASAGIVLNDHWDDMAAEGFISNRLFDAVASGARVVSDYVDGIETLFGGAVQTYRDHKELVWLCSADAEGAFPDDAAVTEVAARILREHTFVARAEQLLDAVLAFRER